MKAITSAICLLALTAAGCDDSAPAETATETAARHAAAGPHAVGYTVLSHARGDAPALAVKAWYPTTAAAADVAYDAVVKLPGFGADPVPFLGHAALDGAPAVDGGPYPLVVLSHGFGMNPEWYHPLAEHLASHGLVVLGPEHSEHDWATDVVAASGARPREVSQTIDLAEAGALGGAIDADRVAVIGHSYGGYTALAAAGARVELGQLEARCADESDPFLAGFFCAPFMGAGEALAQAMGLEAPPEGLWPGVGDARIDAVVPIAADAFLFGAEGLAHVTVPTLLIGGTGDTAAPWDWGTGMAFEHVGSATRGLVALEGADHFFMTTTCDRMPWTQALPEEFQAVFCSDPAWEKPAALALTAQVTTSFLMETLVGEPQAAAALDPALFAAWDGLSVTFSRD